MEGRASAGKAKLRKLQWECAKSGNIAMLIWLGKQWLGQQERLRTELTGAEGKDLMPTNLYTLDELLEIKAIHDGAITRADKSIQGNAQAGSGVGDEAAGRGALAIGSGADGTPDDSTDSEGAS